MKTIDVGHFSTPSGDRVFSPLQLLIYFGKLSLYSCLYGQVIGLRTGLHENLRLRFSPINPAVK